VVTRVSNKKKVVWRSAAAERLRRLAGFSPNVEHAVRAVCERLLNAVSCPPTDLDAVGGKLNVVRFIEEDGLPVSGQLRRGEKGFEIVCSRGMALTRKRFTVAHELGHAIFESTGPNCPRSGGELERLCDMLAAEILMPQSVCDDYLGETVKLDDVFRMARLFQVSLSAAVIRCAELRGVSMFEATSDRVNWGYGRIKGGLVRVLNSEIREVVERAVGGEKVEVTVPINGVSWRGDWRIEGAPIGQTQRALLLLQRKT
jgi:IrrE N-terminal-like domain